MYEYVIGIDPGKSGALVVLPVGRPEPANWIAMPTPKDMYLFLKQYSGTPCFAVLELVHSMPGQGVKSVFTFGVNRGHIEMALLAASIPFEEVSPSKWLSTFGYKKAEGESKTSWKNRLKSLAQQLFPDEKIALGNADAFLIAEYCRRTYT